MLSNEPRGTTRPCVRYLYKKSVCGADNAGTAGVILYFCHRTSVNDDSLDSMNLLTNLVPTKSIFKEFLFAYNI